MTNCRVDILPLEEAREAANEVDMILAFAELNIFRVMLQRPKTAKALSDLLVSLLFGGELDDRLRELLIMRIGWSTGSDYEWTQHWKIARDQFGCSDQDLLELRGDWRKSGHFGDDERTLLAAVDELVADTMISDATWGVLAQHLTTEQLIDMIFTVGHYNMVAMSLNAIGVQREAGIPGFDGQQGG